MSFDSNESGSPAIKSDKILQEYISGFHRCILGPRVTLDYAGEDFRKLTGYTNQEFHDLFNNEYTAIIYPDDIAKFENFAKRMAAEEIKGSLNYRIIKKNSSLIHVREDMYSRKNSDGDMVGYSTVMDITEINEKNNTLQGLNDAIPCGIVVFSCDKPHRIQYENYQMANLISGTDTEKRWKKHVQDNFTNIFTFEDKLKFEECIESASKSRAPVAFNSLRILHKGSQLLEVDGWVYKVHNTESEDKFEAIFIDVTRQIRIEHNNKISEILSVIDPLYEKILEFDTARHVEKLHKGEFLGHMPGENIFDERPIRSLIENHVLPQHRLTFLKAFNIMTGSAPWDFKKGPFEFNYGTLHDGEKTKYYSASIINVDETTHLFCCRPIASLQENPGMFAASSHLNPGLQEAGDSADIQRSKPKEKIFIRTFGYFDVFIDSVPIAFRSKKAKELLAILVDRKGGFVSPDEIISLLWENDPVDQLTLSRCRKTYMRLVEILKEYGIEDIVETKNRKRRVIPERFSCDLYGYLNGEPECIDAFKGAYLSSYSWGEFTLSTLVKN